MTTVSGARLRRGMRRKPIVPQERTHRRRCVQQGEIAGYENDKRVPTAPKLAALAKALKVPMEALVEDVPLPRVEHPSERAHGNSTAAQIQKLVLQLDRGAQALVLKQVKLILTANSKNSDDSKHSRKRAA